MFLSKWFVQDNSSLYLCSCGHSLIQLVTDWLKRFQISVINKHNVITNRYNQPETSTQVAINQKYPSDKKL